MNEPQDFLSTKVVFLSFAASLVTLAVAAGLTTGALCWGRFFLALIFCYIGEEMRIIYTISKKKITKKKKGTLPSVFSFLDHAPLHGATGFPNHSVNKQSHLKFQPLTESNF